MEKNGKKEVKKIISPVLNPQSPSHPKSNPQIPIPNPKNVILDDKF